MTTSVKILHILDHSIPLHSGYTFRTRAILKQQRLLGWETFHVTSAKQINALQDMEIVDGLTFYRSAIPSKCISAIPLLNQWAIVQSLVNRLHDLIPLLKPDILHAHSPALNGLAALQVAKKYNLPLVYECRAFWEDAAVDHGKTQEGSWRYRLTHALETYVFQNANSITTICDGLRNDIINRGIAPSKITVIPNAVDIDKFCFAQPANRNLQQSLNLTDKIVLGFIGSFYAYEGLLLLLDALSIIIQQRANVVLLLVGGGPQEQAIKDKINSLWLHQQVLLVGRVPHDQVQQYYNLVDIFVYPRLAMRLTNLVTPLKPLEAMAQGRLVVASNVGGHQELIREGQTGYLFQANNPQALANTVLTLLNNQTQWDNLRQAGRIYVENERNWKSSVANYQTIYQQLLN